MADLLTISNLATGGGTLVLALATFGSVRSANRAVRVAEQALLQNMRPVLMPTRREDPHEKIMWADQHWAHIPGGQAIAEIVDGNLYLAFSIRNAGNGLGVLQSWQIHAPYGNGHMPDRGDVADYRQHSRDLYVPSNDTGFWQAALRDQKDPLYQTVRRCLERPEPMAVDLLYSDHEGGQRVITRFGLFPHETEDNGTIWLLSVSRHWNLDHHNPR